MRYNTSVDSADSVNGAAGGATGLGSALSQILAIATMIARRQRENRFAEDTLQVAFCVARRGRRDSNLRVYLALQQTPPVPQDARTSRGRNDATRSCTLRGAAESDGRQAIRPTLAVGGSAGSPEASGWPNHRSYRQAQ